MKSIHILLIAIITALCAQGLMLQHEREMKKLELERHYSEWELKIRLKEAMATQAMARNHELEMVKQFVSKSGEVCTSL